MTKRTNKQIAGFVVSGLLSTALMYALYILFHRYTNYQYAYFFSYLISVLALYFMNILVFKAPISLHTFLKFPLIYALQYILGAGVLELFVRLGIPSLFAPLLIVIVLLPVTFILNKMILK